MTGLQAMHVCMPQNSSDIGDLVLTCQVLQWTQAQLSAICVQGDAQLGPADLGGHQYQLGHRPSQAVPKLAQVGHHATRNTEHCWSREGATLQEHDMLL